MNQLRTPHLHRIEDARRMARRRVPRIMFDYVDGAAGNESGMRLNTSRLDAIRLQPRGLVNVEGRSLGKRILGMNAGLPFGIPPMGMCNLTWPGADRILAAEAVRREVPVCHSTAASCTLEDTRRWASDWAWYQLYVAQSFEVAFSFVDRAENAGYEVLMLTVDVPQVARRERDLDNGFQVPFKIGPRQFFDFATHPHWSISTLMNGAPEPLNYSVDSGGTRFVRMEGRGRTDYEFLDRLRDRWKRTLVVKGVMSADEALHLKQAGVDAIYVSNHGGRQLSSTPAAIDVLPFVRAAVGDDYPLIFDSGVRSGEHVVKALALGADFVMLGRPMLYAIGADGERGLSTVFDLVREDIDAVLAQIGRRDVESVDADVIAHDYPTP